MDTYTKQVDCPEIQGLWESKEGDRVWIHAEEEMGMVYDPDDCPVDRRYLYIWLPRQSDWQNILFRKYYAPAVPTKKKIHAATIRMHEEIVEYMEDCNILQPCEAWVQMFMILVHKKYWRNGKWHTG